MNEARQMGEITQLAYSFIEEDLLVMNDELNPMDVLDFLQDGDNFKRIADLLKETMIAAKIPAKTKQLLNGYPTVNCFLSDLKTKKIEVSVLNESDSTDSFINALLSLLSRQEDECLHQKRKENWNRSTITRWFTNTPVSAEDKSGKAESIKNRNDAIAICFAVGLDYPTAREFINKCGHAIFNIRNPKDAIYIYGLVNNVPLSEVKEIIDRYYHAEIDNIIKSSALSDNKKMVLYKMNTIKTHNEDGSIRNCFDFFDDFRVEFEKLEISEQKLFAETLVGNNKRDIFLAIASLQKSDLMRISAGDSKKLSSIQGRNNAKKETVTEKSLKKILSLLIQQLSETELLTVRTMASSVTDDLYGFLEGKDHSGNTTELLTKKIIGNSNWETSEQFFNTFLIPHMNSFISYSRSAIKEYYKLKIPIYLNALKKELEYQYADYNLRIKQLHIHSNNPDNILDDEILPRNAVQVMYNFINYLNKYSSKSTLLKQANDMLDIRIERIEKGWNTMDFKVINNSVEVIDFLISNYESLSDNEYDQKVLSDFLTDTVTAYRMLCRFLPSVVVDDDIRDKRQNAYVRSSLSDSVLKSFPHRNFFSQFEKNPEKLVHDMSIRKAIILLHYMNYAESMIHLIKYPNSIFSSVKYEFGLENFIESMNEILGKCQLGKLYCANPFDWLILESVKKLQTYNDDEDIENPIAFLDKVLECSFIQGNKQVKPHI